MRKGIEIDYVCGGITGRKVPEKPGRCMSLYTLFIGEKEARDVANFRQSK